ncbi:MAG: FG-GAP-like repeat-containing protein [Planctomycetota bacterium]|jgi:WD40 repeat protein
MKHLLVAAGLFLWTIIAGDCLASLTNLGPEEFVQADGSDITVPGYSVPSYVDWDNDGRMDLIVGEGSGSYAGKVRVYLNAGTQSDPQFSGYSYVQANGGDLSVAGSGCLGVFPRVVYWDGDTSKDLLIGQSDGTLRILLNTGTDTNPTFDAGTYVQVGPLGTKTNIDIGYRACPTVVDWNNDGKKDLAVGALDGQIHLFINEGTDIAPDFLIEVFAQQNSSDLIVPYQRSSPVILDLDGDGNKDLLTGDSLGQLLFYSNTGTDAAPAFSGYSILEGGDIPINLLDSVWSRSRPFVCDWTGDGYLDVLVGAADGKIHLFQGIPEPATICLLAFGGLTLLRKRRR